MLGDFRSCGGGNHLPHPPVGLFVAPGRYTPRGTKGVGEGAAPRDQRSARIRGSPRGRPRREWPFGGAKPHAKTLQVAGMDENPYDRRRLCRGRCGSTSNLAPPLAGSWVMPRARAVIGSTPAQDASTGKVREGHPRHRPRRFAGTDVALPGLRREGARRYDPFSVEVARREVLSCTPHNPCNAGRPSRRALLTSARSRPRSSGEGATATRRAPRRSLASGTTSAALPFMRAPGRRARLCPGSSSVPAPAGAGAAERPPGIAPPARRERVSSGRAQGPRRAPRPRPSSTTCSARRGSPSTRPRSGSWRRGFIAPSIRCGFTRTIGRRHRRAP